jgi:hypothetical protein
MQARIQAGCRGSAVPADIYSSVWAVTPGLLCSPALPCLVALTKWLLMAPLQCPTSEIAPSQVWGFNGAGSTPGPSSPVAHGNSQPRWWRRTTSGGTTEARTGAGCPTEVRKVP